MISVEYRLRALDWFAAQLVLLTLFAGLRMLGRSIEKMVDATKAAEDSFRGMTDAAEEIQGRL